MPTDSTVRLTALTLLLATCATSQAELQKLDDQSLASVVGKGYIQIDRYQSPRDESVHFVRTTLGAKVETQINADHMILGQYPRWDDQTNDWESQDADIHIDNYAMGHIFEKSYYLRNPLIPEPTKPDGSAYRDGEIVPFRMINPYLELAMEDVDGSSQLVGVRLGFGEAEGSISGDIRSLTGNVDTLVRTDAAGLAAQNGLCDPVLCESILSGVEITNPARLVYPKGSPNNTTGELDQARATAIGIPNGEAMTVGAELLGTDLINIDLTAQGCMAAVTEVCFPLSQYQTLWVGATDEQGALAGTAPGMFMSFQARALEWLKKTPDANLPENYMQTVSGAFLNLPAGASEIHTIHAINGTPRARTEYIDRNLF